MYYPGSMVPRREPVANTATIQKILDDNVRLIHNVIMHQKSGATKEMSEMQQILHKNLVYLATIADETTNASQRPPVAGGMPPQGFPTPPVSVGDAIGQRPLRELPVQGQPQQSMLVNYQPQQQPTSRGQMPPGSMPVAAAYIGQQQQGPPPHQYAGGPLQMSGPDERSYIQQRVAPPSAYGYLGYQNNQHGPSPQHPPLEAMMQQHSRQAPVQPISHHQQPSPSHSDHRSEGRSQQSTPPTNGESQRPPSNIDSPRSVSGMPPISNNSPLPQNHPASGSETGQLSLLVTSPGLEQQQQPYSSANIQ